MNYDKFTFALTPDNQDYRDILMANLGDIGFESFVENDINIEAYIPSNLCIPNSLDSIDFKPLFSFEYQQEQIPEQNWNEVWEKNYFNPLVVSNRCLIRAPFHTDYPAAEYELIIEPKMAFGTGNHETTSLMIEHILNLEIKDKKVLDMGCGTGVLAMLASKRGAVNVKAIDIDKWSFESTQENIELNNCTLISVELGDSSLLGNEYFDIIFANIHKNILIEDLPKYASVLNSEGIIILSGFYEKDVEDIEKIALSLNLKTVEVKSRNKWVAVSFVKK